MRNARSTPMMGLMALAVASPTLVAGQTNSESSMSRTLQVNSLNDFCLFAPPRAGVTIGDSEAYEVAYCTAPNRGTRSMPAGTIKSAREFDDFLETPHYTQITGTGDFTKINVQRGDEGGELDPHGATGQGNPVGGVVYSGGTQVYEWHEFISDTEFCIRVCKPSVPDAWLWCQHIYDLQGCGWNDPGQYGSGFDTCEGDGADYPPGIYPVSGGGFTTYEQGDGSTPAPPAHAAGASSNCVAQNTINGNAGPVTRASAVSFLSGAVVTTPVTTTAALSTTTTTSTTLAVVTVFSTASTASTSAIAATSSAAVRTTSGAVSMNPKVLLGVGASILSVLFTLALFA
ncbi:BZ3500_MvSof-1268-A1-R1_Chr11-3g03511 [Microbotryum saponariae]|uniref:BZ3500_MvSof-1268-A1-R1_Chr11-3g03511 protein n=1 Tax=Microbotryum saponariae TaxID=289078 RepID=A0A2X0KQ07_9BASI|nr:BZ3500_MvSof-1268-A1-R1_Chr11-3g03511 [Microbotryum saponariae]SDA03520.1 BZ3501_MvSof-1269-A2-R1_Chr11g03088 [Microbotryum saponariae]